MELLLSICLVASPIDCRNETLVVSMEPVGPVHCMITAPQTIAEWQSGHPKWRVMRWRCGNGMRTAGRDI